MKSLLTVIGNLIIIKSFVSNPKLRTMNNLYIINLAIADIIIGLVSMNFFTVYLVSNSWIFGPTICDAWLTIDYVASNTSVLTLVIICFDRYCSGKAFSDQADLLSYLILSPGRGRSGTKAIQSITVPSITVESLKSKLYNGVQK